MKPSPNMLRAKIIDYLVRGNNLIESFSENVKHRVVSFTTNYSI